MLRPYLDLPREIHLLCLGVLINRAGTFLLPFLTIYLSQRLKLGESFATTAIGVFGLGAIVGALLGGQLADRVGRKVTMLTALFGSAAIILGYSQLSAPAAILAVTFFLPVVADMYRPAVQAFIADVVDPVRRPYAYGLNFITINLGAAVGPLIGGVLAEHSFTWLFIGNALATAACGVVIACAIPETLGWAAGRGPATKDVLAAGRDDAANGRSTLAGREATFAVAARHIAHDTTFLFFCLGTLLVAVVYVQCFSTLPLYLQRLGLGPTEYSRIIALNGALIVAFQIPITNWVTGLDRGRTLAVAALLTAMGYGLKQFMGQEWQFGLCVLVWTIGEMMSVPLIGPIVADLAPASMRARYMAVSTLAFSGANSLAAPIGGWILTRFGGAALWNTTMAVAMCAAVLFLMLRRRVARRTIPVA